MDDEYEVTKVNYKLGAGISLFLSNIAKETARFSFPIQRKNRFQQFYIRLENKCTAVGFGNRPTYIFRFYAITRHIYLFTNILVEKPCQLKLILLQLLSSGFTLSLRFITLKQFKMLSGVVQVF